MAIKKRSINSQGSYTDYKHLVSNYNQSSINNYSHKVDTPTNFNLKTITLEDIDQAVYQEFNKRFRIGIKDMSVLLLDSDVTSLHNENYEQFDEARGFLNLPFLTLYRTKTTPILKTNPTWKQVVYSVPISKPNGLVMEEYITEGPIVYELLYQMKFITNYRESTNQMEQQIAYYFRNKRNMILCNGERFVIGPESQGTLGELEVTNFNADQRTLYITTFNLKLWCYTRDLSNMQKRERPNTFLLDISVSDSINIENTQNVINVERYETDNSQYPIHPVPNNNYK